MGRHSRYAAFSGNVEPRDACSSPLLLRPWHNTIVAKDGTTRLFMPKKVFERMFAEQTSPTYLKTHMRAVATAQKTAHHMVEKSRERQHSRHLVEEQQRQREKEGGADQRQEAQQPPRTSGRRPSQIAWRRQPTDLPLFMDDNDAEGGGDGRAAGDAASSSAAAGAGPDRRRDKRGSVFEERLEGDWRRHYNDGVTAFQAGDLARAAACFRTAVACEPGAALAHDNLGVCLGRLGDRRGALAACRQATELDPNNANTWRNLGVALRAVGDTGGAAMADRRMRKCISI